MYTPPAILGLQILILLDFYSNKSPACPIKEPVALTLTIRLLAIRVIGF